MGVLKGRGVVNGCIGFLRVLVQLGAMQLTPVDLILCVFGKVEQFFCTFDFIVIVQAGFPGGGGIELQSRTNSLAAAATLHWGLDDAYSINVKIVSDSLKMLVVMKDYKLQLI